MKSFPDDSAIDREWPYIPDWREQFDADYRHIESLEAFFKSQSLNETQLSEDE